MSTNRLTIRIGATRDEVTVTGASGTHQFDRSKMDNKQKYELRSNVVAWFDECGKDRKRAERRALAEKHKVRHAAE